MNKYQSTHAIISKCGKYRYSLSRVWDDKLPMAMFIMLNPSTADGIEDDPTIRRCVGFAKDWGYGGILVGNLYAYRCKKPKDLFKVKYPHGANNEYYISKMVNKAGIVICAWGNGDIIKKLGKPSIYHTIRKLTTVSVCYLELCKDGTPKHPLYLRSELKPIPYHCVKLENNHII